MQKTPEHRQRKLAAICLFTSGGTDGNEWAIFQWGEPHVYCVVVRFWNNTGLIYVWLILQSALWCGAGVMEAHSVRLRVGLTERPHTVQFVVKLLCLQSLSLPFLFWSYSKCWFIGHVKRVFLYERWLIKELSLIMPRTCKELFDILRNETVCPLIESL